MALILVKIACLLAGIAILMRHVLPRVLKRLAASSEMMVLFAITWALALSACATG